MPAEAEPAARHAAVVAARHFLSSFKTPGLILCAVSGGSDSKGLLLALQAAIAACDTPGFSLAACTVDHALRGESAAEALAVAQMCAASGISHVTCRWEGEKPTAGIQAAAREKRYALLADVAKRLGALCIVTGHTDDDQRETIAMRQLRSKPGAHGLAGMADAVLYDRRIWILRPFLTVSRADIRAFLIDNNENWLDDPSNVNRHFERVRIRQQMETGHSAEPPTAAGRRQASSANAACLLQRYAQVFCGLVARIDPDLAGRVADPDAARGILSLAAALGGRSSLAGTETCTRLMNFIAGGQDGRMTAARVVFDRRRSGLFLYREARGLPVSILAPGEETVWDGRFRVANETVDEVTIGTMGDRSYIVKGLVEAGVPDAVAKRAAKAAGLPFLPHAASCEPPTPSRADVHLSLYDTFLPRFDVMLANRIAALFGRKPYLPLPVHDVLTENKGWA